MTTNTDVISPTSNVSAQVRQVDEKVNANFPFAEAHDLSQETLEGLYAYAYDFYHKGRLDDAELLFKFLCIYDFFNADYLKGYAAVCQLKKDYQRACDLYGISFTVSNQNDYSTIYLMGQCLLCMKKFESSQECFKTVSENTSDDDLKCKADKYIELLSELTKPVKEGELQ